MNKCLLEKLINNGTPDMYAAFAETIKQEIASDEDTYESIGYNLLKALLTDDADDILVALCGWYVDTLLAKARIVPDTKVEFYDSPLYANIVSVDISGKEYLTPCKVNMQTFEVYDIQTGVFGMVQADPQIFNQAQVAGKNQVLTSACRSGILQTANDNAQKQVQSLFALANVQVTVKVTAPTNNCR